MPDDKRTDDEAWTLALRHQGLARKWSNSEDQFQDAMLGLYRAAKTWDSDRAAFSTWSRFYIMAERQKRAAVRQHGIRFTHNIGEKVRDIAVEQRRRRDAGLPDDLNTVARHLGMSPTTAAVIMRRTESRRRSWLDSDERAAEPEIERFTSGVPAQLDDDWIPLADIDKAIAAIDALSEREQRVISLRFDSRHKLGLGGMTLSEMGSAMGLSRERVNQILREAIAKLRKAVAEPVRREDYQPSIEALDASRNTQHYSIELANDRWNQRYEQRQERRRGEWRSSGYTRWPF